MKFYFSLVEEFTVCGVVGIIHCEASSSPHHYEGEAQGEVFRALLTLQHRGQDAAGIVSYDFATGHFYEEKNLGLVSQVFNQQNLAALKGAMAIGHNRYATVGSDGRRDLQPLINSFPFGVAMAHNGNIVNYFKLKESLKINHHIQMLTHNDLELILSLWGKAYLELSDSIGPFTFDHCIKAFNYLFETLIGAYSTVGLIADQGLIAFRDPSGIKPLCFGKKLREDGGVAYCFASEEVALNFLDYKFERDLLPGEVIFISQEGEFHSWVYPKVPAKSACMFEWVYFAAAESSLEGRSVYGARLALGEKLAVKVAALITLSKISPDIVVPVPDTGRTAAIALSEKLRIPYREGLMKNRYVQRSFILAEQNKREKAVELKLTPIRKEIEGKNILLIDDSIVRGTTSQKIISLLKKNGAGKITLALSCPPIKNACYYGIDFPDGNDLAANKMNTEELAIFLGADAVVFLDQEDLIQSIYNNKKRQGLCMACVSGVYPTDISSGDEFAVLRENGRS